MSNTYAINTTRNKEFEVEEALSDIGLHPWVPRLLANKYVKEKRDFIWYDKPYVPKLMFCVIPAIYWPDVVKQKHVIGKPVPLSRLDIDGIPAHEGPSGHVGARPGLRGFKEAVESEYADMERRKKNSEYECLYVPGQALEILCGPFEGFTGEFQKIINAAHNEYGRIAVSVDIFGRATRVELDPDEVTVA